MMHYGTPKKAKKPSAKMTKKGRVALDQAVKIAKTPGGKRRLKKRRDELYKELDVIWTIGQIVDNEPHVAAVADNIDNEAIFNKKPAKKKDLL